MAILGLNLPTDILWERVCVTEDMMDPKACDSETPPKWHTSMALFRYIPEKEYQVHPGRRLVYYKLVCTITSYQPQDKEIEGQLDWHRVHPSLALDFEQKLKSYKPCNGAVIQVTVTPPNNSTNPLSDYPYFLDFQPKQRALYEQATDTNERSSRSLESLSVSKGAGTARSTEALDVDTGSSSELGINAGGAGGKVGHSQSGMWGTKRLSRDDQSNVQTSDSAREARDTVSHTTEISQMYNLFQAYHQGTNRALFYMAPRPHILEEPSGFIRGPRILDGIQEIFMIVSQPEGQGLPCLSVRLDTAHLTFEDQLDYDRSQTPVFLGVDVAAEIPSRSDPDLVPTQGYQYHDCFQIVRQGIDTKSAPDGYHFESWVDVFPPEAENGSVEDPIFTPDKKTITLKGQATGSACFRNEDGDNAQAAATALSGYWFINLFTGQDFEFVGQTENKRSGRAKRQIKVELVSDKPTKVVGQIPVLLITSRGLCCCAGVEGPTSSYDPRVIAVHPLPERDWLRLVEDVKDRPGQTIPPQNPAYHWPGGVFTARQANQIQEMITAELKRISSSVTNPGAIKSLERSYIMGKLTAISLASKAGAWWMGEPLKRASEIKGHNLKGLEEMLNKPRTVLTRYDVAKLTETTIASTMKISEARAIRLRLAALGFPSKPARG